MSEKEMTLEDPACESCVVEGIERAGVYSTTVRRVLCWRCLMQAIGEKTRREAAERSKQYPVVC